MDENQVGKKRRARRSGEEVSDWWRNLFPAAWISTFASGPEDEEQKLELSLTLP
jgi:hypothetical protein